MGNVMCLENNVTNEAKDMSNAKSEVSSVPTPTLRPWYVYLMAGWAFIGVGGFLSSIVRTLAGNNQQALQFASIVVLVFAVVLVVNVLKMKKAFLILFGVLCALLAAWQLVNAIGVLLSQNPANPVLFLLLFFIAPSVIFAVVSLRPKFLESALRYRAHREQEAMRKVAMKQVGR